MAKTITFKGKDTLHLEGRELKVGDRLPDFVLVGNDMQDLKPEAFAGKALVISAVPSLDTPVCSIETVRFNKMATELTQDVAVLTVSMDLPFAQKRWCGAEGVERVVTGSDYKYRSFGPAFGALIKEWGLLARAVFVADKTGTVRYVEYVPEVSAEPEYDKVLAAVKAL